MSVPSFQAIASAIFKHMGLSDDPTTPDGQAYTVTIGKKLEIHVVGAIGVYDEFVSMLCAAGSLSGHADSPALLKLLYANRFRLDHPSICIGMDQETQNVIVWTRQKRVELAEKKRNKLVRPLRQSKRVRAGCAHNGAPLSNQPGKKTARRSRKTFEEPSTGRHHGKRACRIIRP